MMKPNPFRALLLASLLAVAACAPAGTRSGSSLHRDSRRITQEEIESNSQLPSLMELVQLLRPAWLRGRGVENVRHPTAVQVYYDNVLLGGPESLRNVRVTGVVSLQYFDAAEATLRWGTGNTQGAIAIRTH